MFTSRDIGWLRKIMKRDEMMPWELNAIRREYNSLKTQRMILPERKLSPVVMSKLSRVPISDLGLPATAYVRLRWAGIETVADLVQKREDEVFAMRLIGVKAMAEIQAALWAYGGLNLTLRRHKTVAEFEKWLRRKK